MYLVAYSNGQVTQAEQRALAVSDLRDQVFQLKHIEDGKVYERLLAHGVHQEATVALRIARGTGKLIDVQVLLRNLFHTPASQCIAW